MFSLARRARMHPIFAFGPTAIVLGISVVAAAAEPTQPPRAARSVHLAYVAPESTVFYNELTVEKSVPGSYSMACGFNHGYFGIQEQGKGQKVVIFSVWDPTKGDTPGAVPIESPGGTWGSVSSAAAAEIYDTWRITFDSRLGASGLLRAW
jgi:hypothetical protein